MKHLVLSSLFISLFCANAYAADSLLQRIEAHPGVNSTNENKVNSILEKSCHKKNLSNAYVDFEVAKDKMGKIRCLGVRKYSKPHCPKGYTVEKRSCIKA